MTLPHRQKAALAFWQADEAVDDQVQAALLIAQQKKFRPKSVLGARRRAQGEASGVDAVDLPEQIAARALIAYHLEAQRPMMGAFLDALGIAHENGVIQEDDVKPDAAKLAPAVEAIEKAYPAEDVSLYLNVLLCQDPRNVGRPACRSSTLRAEASRWIERKQHFERRALAGRARERDRPARLLRDAVDDRQAEPGALVRVLRREERLEHLRAASRRRCRRRSRARRCARSDAAGMPG